MARRNPNPATAKELMDRLNSDPEYVRVTQEAEERRRVMEDQLQQEEARLVSDIRNHTGMNISSVWDLVNSSSAYPHAVPVLLQHFRRSYSGRIKEGIVRALTVTEARGEAAGILLDELEQNGQSLPRNVTFALANALTVVGSRDMLGRISALIHDNRYGEIRPILDLALKKIARM
jgi:hypothetical protein